MVLAALWRVPGVYAEKINDNTMKDKNPVACSSAHRHVPLWRLRGNRAVAGAVAGRRKSMATSEGKVACCEGKVGPEGAGAAEAAPDSGCFEGKAADAGAVAGGGAGEANGEQESRGDLHDGGAGGGGGGDNDADGADAALLERLEDFFLSNPTFTGGLGAFFGSPVVKAFELIDVEAEQPHANHLAFTKYGEFIEEQLEAFLAGEKGDAAPRLFRALSHLQGTEQWQSSFAADYVFAAVDFPTFVELVAQFAHF